MLRRQYTNQKVHICPQKVVSHKWQIQFCKFYMNHWRSTPTWRFTSLHKLGYITKKKIVWVCSVVFTEKHGCREFLFDGQSHHDIIGVYSTFSRPKTLDCILVINDISNFHKLYIPLLDSLVSLSESTKSFISSRSRSSLK